MVAISLAERSCQTASAMGLQLRLVAMTPTISTLPTSSLQQMRRFEHLDALTVKWADKEVSVFDPSLRYTITPSSMMIGYQSTPDNYTTLTQDSRALRKLNKLLGTVDPSLTQVAPSLLVEKTRQIKGSTLNVGFVSSYLRTHSVGKLIAGVVTSVNSDSHIDCHVFIADHFLPLDVGGDGEYEDLIVKSLKQTLGDRLHVLPKSKQVGRTCNLSPYIVQ